MNEAFEYCTDKADVSQIADHLSACDKAFIPPLSSRVSIRHYARKIVDRAVRFEAWSNGLLVGLVAAYCIDKEKRFAFITNISVLQEWQGKGIASQLLARCVNYAQMNGFVRIELEVDQGNEASVLLYRKYGFNKHRELNDSKIIYLKLLNNF